MLERVRGLFSSARDALVGSCESNCDRPPACTRSPAPATARAACFDMEMRSTRGSGPARAVAAATLGLLLGQATPSRSDPGPDNPPVTNCNTTPDTNAGATPPPSKIEPT